MPGDFVDSNIWLYAFIQGGDAAKSSRATQLIQSIQPIISTQVVSEVSVNLLSRGRSPPRQLSVSLYTDSSRIASR